MSDLPRQLIEINDHESNHDKTAKLEWPTGGQVLRGSVYSCRKGFVAILDGMAFEGHFDSLSEAKHAAQGSVS